MCQKHYSLVWYILKQNIALFFFSAKKKKTGKTELRLIQFNIGWPKRFQKFINHYDLCTLVGIAKCVVSYTIPAVCHQTRVKTQNVVS